jgi:hypothetical protein
MAPAHVHHAKLHTGAAAFATLLALIPWEVLKAAGVREELAAYAAAALLGLAAIAALGARSHSLGQRAFHIKAFRETFEMQAFLRDFAAFAFVELALGAMILVFLATVHE